MDEAVRTLLAELDALGIEIKEDCQEVFFCGSPPPDLVARLQAKREQLAEAVWALKGRRRAAAADERLRADRKEWIEENKRLGKYLGPD